MIILQYAWRFPTTSAGPWPIHLQRRLQIQFRWHSSNHWQLFFRNIAHSVFILAIVAEYYEINNFPILICLLAAEEGGGGGGGVQSRGSSPSKMVNWHSAQKADKPM